MQSDRNSLKTDNFHKPTTYEPHVQTSFEEKKAFPIHEYGRLGDFRIKMRSLIQKLQPLKKCQFSNCSHLIVSHCRVYVVSPGKMSTYDDILTKNCSDLIAPLLYSVMQSDGNSVAGMSSWIALTWHPGRKTISQIKCKNFIMMIQNFIAIHENILT